MKDNPLKDYEPLKDPENLKREISRYESKGWRIIESCIEGKYVMRAISPEGSSWNIKRLNNINSKLGFFVGESKEAYEFMKLNKELHKLSKFYYTSFNKN
jgi:hypothetical protein